MSDNNTPTRDTLNNPEGVGFYTDSGAPEPTEPRAYEVTIRGIVISDDGDPADWSMEALFDELVCHSSIETTPLVKAQARATEATRQSLGNQLFEAFSCSQAEIAEIMSRGSQATPESSEDS